MQHFYDLQQAHLTTPSLVTIGVFDGVHRGHQHLIRLLAESARAQGRLAVALTFFPHPDVVLRKREGRYYLTSAEERAHLLGALGVDCVVTQTFDDAFRQTRAAAYVDLLQHHLSLASLWVGADFALGYQREGNVAFLRAQGETRGFDVKVIDLLMGNGEHIAISSSGIRQALQDGQVEHANAWLGRPYQVSGPVVHGEMRGRTIGFPTANVSVWDEQIIPANGVYAGWARLGGERFMAVTNVGVRPTFAGRGVTVETHLLDFSRDIYDQQLSVSFEKLLRPEKKFTSIQELIAQISADTHAARLFLKGHG